MFNVEDIKLIEWQDIEPEALGGDLAEDLIAMLNKFVRYGLTTWWQKKGFNKESKMEYLSMKGAFDKVIRQAVYFAKTTAVAIKFNIFDEQIANVKEYEARDKYIKLLRSCAVQHKGNKEDGWGGNREHVSCVSELLFACWLVWEKLNIRDKKYVVNVLNTEVDNALQVDIEYNYGFDGVCKDNGESKTLVNMDYANLLYLASVIASKNINAEICRQKAIKMYRACFSSRNDSDLNGFNVDSDMIIHQNDSRSPFATSYIGVGIKAYLLSKLTGEFVPSGITRNFEEIYKAYYEYTTKEDGKKQGLFTNYDKKNRPLGGTIYPDGMKGGKVNESALYVMDIFAFCVGVEKCIDTPAREWAKARIKKIEKSFNKNAKYSYQGANQFKSCHGEAVCSQLSDAYVALFLYVLTKKTENNFIDKYYQETEDDDIQE